VLNAVGTAAIGDVAVVGDGVILHNRPVTVGGVNSAFINARDRGVVAEVVALPLATGVADAPVAVAVVHAAVVAHVASPVTAMEPVVTAVPAPVGRRPQRAFIGSLHPGAGHPVVVALILIVGPVAGHPYEVGFGAVRLLVAGHFRRSESDRDDDLRVDCCGNQREKQRQQEPTRGAEDVHEKSLLELKCLLRGGNRFNLRGARAWVLRSKRTLCPLPRSGQYRTRSLLCFSPLEIQPQ
jgi:hypothetical protein